ncbi:MAG: polysaccharide biosynthesis tyrosine autokinase [Verrucomicrobia bacterium]|nr:polysaccharide biosynthesis tyrosine autokinase [Verrucomicrobiota bacterium]
MDVSKTASPPDSQLHFLDYWRIIRIRRTVILAVFLLVVLTTTAVTFVLKPTYMSTTRIAVEKDVTDVDPLGRTQVSEQFDPYFIQTQFETIQSTSVLYPVVNTNLVEMVNRPEPVSLRQKWAAKYQQTQPLSERETYELLRKDVDVRQSRNTSLIEIRVYNEDKVDASRIANAIAESYREWRMNIKSKQALIGISVLSNRLDFATTNVKERQDKVDKLRVDNNIPDSVAEAPGYQASLEREKVSNLAQELVRAESETVFYSTKLDELKKLDRKELRKTVTTAVPGEQLLPNLLSEYTATEQQLAQLEKDFSREHPDVVRKLALLTKIDEQIEARLDGVLNGLENQVISLKARQAELRNAVEQAKKDVATQATAWREYFQAKRDLENEARIRDAIMLRVLQEEVDAELPKSGAVTIIDKAEPAIRPVRPNIMLNIALGIMVGLVMGVGLAFFIEYLDTSVKTIDDVERALSAPVLGVIPQNVGLLIEEGPESPHAEAYRVLRTNVLFSRKKPDTNALTVVSGGAGEGKSTTIFNLATTFAQNGQRVLVVDSDLRRPSLHKFLNVTNSIGLTNYLLQQNTLEEVIQTTKLPTMDFLPSGKLPSSSLGVLNSTRMKEFIQDVKRRYDFVFFDSPPIMGVSDASILASEVDLALLVVQYRKYPQAMTIRAKQMVEKVGGTMLGVVLNNINISQDSYYYYYSGYYYDYYSKQDKYDRYGRYDRYDRYDRYEGRGERPADGKDAAAAQPAPAEREAGKPLAETAAPASSGERVADVDIKPKY